MYGRRTKCRLIIKLNEFYTTETVDSLFYLWERDDHHERVDADAVAAGTAKFDENLVALYLGIGILRLRFIASVVCVELVDSPFWEHFIYMACVACDILFV